MPLTRWKSLNLLNWRLLQRSTCINWTDIYSLMIFHVLHNSIVYYLVISMEYCSLGVFCNAAGIVHSILIHSVHSFIVEKMENKRKNNYNLTLGWMPNNFDSVVFMTRIHHQYRHDWSEIKIVTHTRVRARQRQRQQQCVRESWEMSLSIIFN